MSSPPRRSDWSRLGANYVRGILGQLERLEKQIGDRPSEVGHLTGVVHQFLRGGYPCLQAWGGAAPPLTMGTDIATLEA